MKMLEEARRLLAEEEAERPELAKHQPCGCIVCTCENEAQCQGCGAKHCGTHPIGEMPNPIYKTPQAPVGLVEELEAWRNEWSMPAALHGTWAKWLDELDEILSRHEATEPKDCGFTLATCPYERCSGITMRNPRATEPLALDSTGCCPKCGLLLKDMSHESLAVLADRKGVRIRFSKREDGVWFFSCVSKHDRKQVCGDNYTAAEAKARAFLMGLPDKGEMK